MTDCIQSKIYHWCKEIPSSCRDSKENNYCIFHAPVNFKGEVTKEAFNDLLLKKMLLDFEAERVCDLSGTVFKWDISIKDFYSEKTLHNMNFSKSIFCRKADFSHVIFKGDAFFSGVKFSGEADFEYAQFLDNAIFSEAVFQGKARFFDAQIRGNADFSHTTFEKTSYFSWGSFRKNVNFEGAAYQEKTIFKRPAF